MAKKRLICNDHDDIHEAAYEILDILSEDDLSLKRTANKIAVRARRIKKLVERAKTSGQSMESRLFDYYNAFIALGFEKKKRKKR